MALEEAADFRTYRLQKVFRRNPFWRAERRSFRFWLLSAQMTGHRIIINLVVDPHDNYRFRRAEPYEFITRPWEVEDFAGSRTISDLPDQFQKLFQMVLKVEEQQRQLRHTFET